MSFFDLPPIIERMLLVSDKISDLNFSVGQMPQVEINGKLTPVQPLGMQKLSPYQTELIAMTLMNGHPDAAEKLARTGTADLSYSLPPRARVAQVGGELLAAVASAFPREYLSTTRRVFDRHARDPD